MKKIARIILIPVIILLIISIPLSLKHVQTKNPNASENTPTVTGVPPLPTSDPYAEDIPAYDIPNSFPSLTGTPSVSPVENITPTPALSRVTATPSPADGIPVNPTEAPVSPLPTSSPAVTPTAFPSPTATPGINLGIQSQEDIFLEVSEATSALSGENAVEEAVEIIIGRLIGRGMKDYDKIKVIHDYLAFTTEYDPDYQSVTDKSDHTYTEYGCLINHCCVCQGYADAFCVIMNRLGIECVEIVENVRRDGIESSAPAHCWNAILLDGYWYHVDVTWDSKNSSASSNFNWGISCEYFLLSDKYIRLDHIIDLAYDINDNRITVPVCGSDLYTDKLPETAFPGCIKTGDIEEAKRLIEKKLESGETEITLFFTGDYFGDSLPDEFKNYLKKLKTTYNRSKASYSMKPFLDSHVLKLNYEL